MISYQHYLLLIRKKKLTKEKEKLMDQVKSIIEELAEIEQKLIDNKNK